MRKLVVNKNLNVRVGKASVNAPCYQYLSPGTIIEVEDEIIKGDLYQGIDKWVKDPAGNHYWLGGFVESEKNKNKNILYNYNRLINLPQKITETKGEGVTVAVFDSGSMKHPKLTPAFAPVLVDLVNPTASVPKDEIGHGTFVAGLIAAAEEDNAEMCGLAPKAKIISVRLSNTTVGIDNVITGLKALMEKGVKPDIINMSFNIAKIPEKVEELEGLIKNDFADTLFICAAQDIITGKKTGIFYPASSALPNVIAVGNHSLAHPNEFDPQIDFVLPDLQFHSLNMDYINQYTTGKGSSYSAGVVSGAYALVISYLKKNNLLQNSTAAFKQELTDADITQFTSSFKIFIP